MNKMEQHNHRSGFTLLEIMFSVVIMSVLSAMVITTFLLLNRSATAMTAYHSTHAGARHALMVISDDIRAASTVSIPPKDSLLNITRQGDQGPRLLNYRLDGNVLKRREGTSDRILCHGVKDLQIGLMTREGKPVSESGRPDMVRVTISFLETTRAGGSTNIFSVVTAMRNAGSQ